VGSSNSKNRPGQNKNQSNNLSTTMHESRQKFSASIKNIMQDLSSLDLHSRHVTDPGNKERKEFKDYVKSRLYLKSVKKLRNDAAVSGLMTPEDYYDLRVLPLVEELEYDHIAKDIAVSICLFTPLFVLISRPTYPYYFRICRREEGRLRLYTRGLQISSMMFSSAAVVLGSAGEIVLIPAVIAAATGLFQFLKVNDYERRFEVASAAARELKGLSAHWESLSDLDHQMRGSIVHLVRTTELLSLQFKTTSAIQVDKAEVGIGSTPKARQQQYAPHQQSFGHNSV